MWGVEICKIYSKIMKKYHHCVKFTYPLSFQTRIPKVDQHTGGKWLIHDDMTIILQRGLMDVKKKSHNFYTLRFTIRLPFQATLDAVLTWDLSGSQSCINFCHFIVSYRWLGTVVTWFYNHNLLNKGVIQNKWWDANWKTQVNFQEYCTWLEGLWE